MARARTGREPRQRLTRERVLEAAINVADAGGIRSLSMRRLAQELGVEAMSLYYHVRNKDEILSAITDAVVAQFELPSPSDHWKAAIHRTALSSYRVLLTHPWAAPLILAGTNPSSARLRHMDAVLGTFRRAGFSAELTDHAYHAVDSHVMGFTLWVVGMNLPDAGELRKLAGSFLAQLPRDELPYLAEHVEQHLKPRPQGEPSEFEFGLNLILDGLERTALAEDDGRGPR